MDAYISAGSKYLNRLSIVVSGDSGSIIRIILETRKYIRLADS